jgi:hypothetical protein
VRRRRNTWPSAVDGVISGLDVVDGSVRIYVRSMVGGPGSGGLSGAATRTRCWSPSSAGIDTVGGRAVWAGQVVTFDVSGSGAVNRCGPRCGRATDVEGGKYESREHGSGNNMAGPAGGCGWKGCRDGLR